MVFSFFWVFCTSLPNQVEHIWLKFQLHICKYDWARIIFVNGGLDSKFQHYGPCKNSWKKSKTSHLDRSSYIEGYFMQNYEENKKVKKVKNQDFMGKSNYFLRTLPFSPWAILATWKMSLILVFNKNSPQGHMESEIGRVWYSQKACEICTSLI
jgi:hypothetical protein